MLKVLKTKGIQGPYLNILKVIHIKLVANIKIHGEKLEVIPLNSETRQGWPLTPYLCKIVLEILAREIRQLGMPKGYKLERKKSKYHYFQMI